MQCTQNCILVMCWYDWSQRFHLYYNEILKTYRICTYHESNVAWHIGIQFKSINDKSNHYFVYYKSHVFPVNVAPGSACELCIACIERLIFAVMSGIHNQVIPLLLHNSRLWERHMYSCGRHDLHCCADECLPLSEVASCTYVKT